jgi:hypothetical protein
MIIFLLLSACGGKSIKEITQNDRNFAIKTDDGHAEIYFGGLGQMSIDGIQVEPTRVIAAAIGNALQQISTRFSSLEEIVNSNRPKSEWAPYTLSVFYVRDNASKTISTTPLAVGDTKWWQNAQKSKAYNSLTQLTFDCTGDTPQICSKKLGEAAADAVMPIVSQFIKDLGY